MLILLNEIRVNTMVDFPSLGNFICCEEDMTIILPQPHQAIRLVGKGIKLDFFIARAIMFFKLSILLYSDAIWN